MPIVTLLVQPASQQAHVKIEDLFEKILITKPPNGIALLRVTVSSQQDLKHISLVSPFHLSKEVQNLSEDVNNTEVRNLSHRGYSSIDCDVIKEGTRQVTIELKVSFLNLLTKARKGWLLAWHINNLNSLQKPNAPFFEKAVPKINASKLEQTLICPKRLEVVDADWSVPLMKVNASDLEEFQDILKERELNRIQKTGHKWRWLGHDEDDSDGYIPAKDTKRCNKIYLRGKYTVAEKLGMWGFALASVTFLKMVIDYAIGSALLSNVGKWIKDK